MISKIESQADVSGLIEVFSEVWGAETLSEFVSSIQSTECILVKANGSVVGYAFFGRDDRGFIEITDIGVCEICRGKGCGGELLDYIIRQHPCVMLTVRADNPARHVYEKFDFKVVDEYKNYYGVGADGIRMARGVCVY